MCITLSVSWTPLWKTFQCNFRFREANKYIHISMLDVSGGWISYSSYYFFYVKELKELKGTLRNLINCFLLFFYPLKFTQIGFLTIKELFSHHFFFFYFIYTLYLSQIPLAAKNILLLYNWIKTCFNVLLIET